MQALPPAFRRFDFGSCLSKVMYRLNRTTKMNIGGALFSQFSTIVFKMRLPLRAYTDRPATPYKVLTRVRVAPVA